MFFIGQSIFYKSFSTAKPLPAILVGFTSGWPVITYRETDGRVVEKKQVYLVDLNSIREPADTPTKNRIYYGRFCRYGLIGPITITIKDNEKLQNEFDNIQAHRPTTEEPGTEN